MSHHMIMKCQQHDEVVGPTSCTECGDIHGYNFYNHCPADCPKHVPGPPSADELCTEALTFIEAARKVARDVDLEADMSLKDWVDQIASNTKIAARYAREADMWTQLEAWHVVAATVLGRIETIMRLMHQSECDHDWPEKAEPSATCPKCGKSLGDHIRDQQWAELELTDDDKK